MSHGECAPRLPAHERRDVDLPCQRTQHPLAACTAADIECCRQLALRAVVGSTGDDTGGTLFLSQTTIPPGFPGPPRHRHKGLHDMFYVLDGVLTVRIGEQTEVTAAQAAQKSR